MSERPDLRLVVGFNRPFSKSSQWLRNKFGTPGPIMMHYRVNAGFVPPTSWVHDPETGGGRLLGEGCHFLDFLMNFAGAQATTVRSEAVEADRSDLQATANFTTTVRFENGALGQLLYSSQGAQSMGKEFFEFFAGGFCGSLDDYRIAHFYTPKTHETLPRHVQDKGQGSLLDSFLSSVRAGSKEALSPGQILESSLLTLAAQQSLLTAETVSLENLRRELV
jgi:predicted dehydrogenase